MDKIKAGRENKPHIGIFGSCNAGKSTLLNFITGTDASIVSPEHGTTTDLVRKSYEIPGFSPVIFIDTGGLDDTSALSAQRIARTREAILQVDLAIIIYRDWGRCEEELAGRLDAGSVPYIRVRNTFGAEKEHYEEDSMALDVLNGTTEDHSAIVELIKRALPGKSYTAVTMFGDLVRAGDRVILVCPIDSEAPAGRMILPQMQAVREALDRNALAIVVQPSGLSDALGMVGSPRMVVTDSQVYREVRQAVPDNLEVTTFSILLAGAKGDMELYTKGLETVDTLLDGDRVLIAENCSHQVSCDDIGRVKIPAWLETYTGKKLDFTFVTGLSALPEDLSVFRLMVQCGGCMITRSQLRNRIRMAASHGMPVTNYGMLIKKIRG